MSWFQKACTSNRLEGGGTRCPGGGGGRTRCEHIVLCSSKHAELVVLNAALEAALVTAEPRGPAGGGLPVDSTVAVLLLSGGAAAQTSALGAEIWHKLGCLLISGRAVHLQWRRCTVVYRSTSRRTCWPRRPPRCRCGPRPSTSRRSPGPLPVTRAAWPQGWYRSVVSERTPVPLHAATRDEVVDIHQIRAGRWTLGTLTAIPPPHRTTTRRKSPLRRCPRMQRHRMPSGSVCRLRGGGGHAGAHLAAMSTCLFGSRLRVLGSICPTERHLQQCDDVVAYLATEKRPTGADGLRHRHSPGLGPGPGGDREEKQQQ